MLPTSEIDFKKTPVTLILVILIAAIEIVCSLDEMKNSLPQRRFYYYHDLRLGILSTVWSGELWRPFTTTLLHGGFVHAALNLTGILTLGRYLENRLGASRYVSLVLLLAYTSVLPSYLIRNLDTQLNTQAGSVGISGVLFGFFGFLWIGRRWKTEFYAICDDRTVRVAILWFFSCIIATRLNVMRIDNWGHCFGAVFGVLYGLACYSPRHRVVWRAVAFVLSLIVLTMVVAAPGHPLYQKHQKNQQVIELQQQFDTTRK